MRKILNYYLNMFLFITHSSVSEMLKRSRYLPLLGRARKFSAALYTGRNYSPLKCCNGKLIPSRREILADEKSVFLPAEKYNLVSPQTRHRCVRFHLNIFPRNLSQNNYAHLLDFSYNIKLKR